MPNFRDQIIVLRTYKLGESDRIISLLSKDNGVFQAVAKGVRKTSSSFGARLEPFMLADCYIYSGKSLAIIRQAVSLESYGASIVQDYEKFQAASLCAEAVQKIVAVEEKTPQQFMLLKRVLASFAEGAHPTHLTAASYLLRALSIGGWAPNLESCMECDKRDFGSNERVFFDENNGAIFCENCRNMWGSSWWSSGELEHVRALRVGNWQQAYLLDTALQLKIYRRIISYAQWQLECKFKSNV